ncbi:MAG: hypothetical protein H6Q03_1072 [Acidobacteria bacterium]|jgi:hypothetical protein|nr:hypothetical protein [Acidobacteriota bacterium]
MEPASPVPGSDERRTLLAALGAEGAVLDELSGYLQNPYERFLSGPPGQRFPLEEEPQAAFWRRYAAEAERDGVVAALRRRFPQLCFPIGAGLSRDPAYRAATRRGEWNPEGPGGLALEQPGALELAVDEGPAGPVPVLVARHRPDFVALVQALTGRNEPEPVPAAMGACLVKGLADWERVAAYRRAWEQRRGAPAGEEEWAAEMAAGLAPNKELWQDRLIVLSDGPYSAVPAAEADLEEEAWRRASRAVRLAHESFHYLTLRLAGSIRSHLLDELVADYAGLLAAFGRYDARLALRFLGLDRLPETRPDGRLQVYRGALSDGALDVLGRLVAAAARALATLPVREAAVAPAAARARTLVALAGLGLDGIAAEDLPARFAAAWRSVGAAT